MLSRLGRAVPWVAVGGLAAYLFDPQSGRRRRASLADRTRAALRRRRRSALAEARFIRGRARGVVARTTGRGRPHPGSDVERRDLIHAAIARCPVDTRDVTTEYVDGVVTLRGQVATLDASAMLVATVRTVPGVCEVRNLVHLPGQPAPNKVAALSASG